MVLEKQMSFVDDIVSADASSQHLSHRSRASKAARDFIDRATEIDFYVMEAYKKNSQGTAEDHRSELIDSNKKLSTFATICAIVKAIAGLGVMLTSKAFSGGGYLFSPAMLVVSGVLTCFCLHRLADCAANTGVCNYNQLGYLAFGKRVRILLEVLIGICQASFVLSHQSYIYQTLLSIGKSQLNVELSQFWVAFVILAAYYTLALFRNLKKFSFSTVTGIVCLQTTVLITVVFCSIEFAKPLVIETETEAGIKTETISHISRVVAFNEESYLGMLGFAVYCYEGIGCILPIMESTGKPGNFKRDLNIGFVFMMIWFCLVGEMGYLAYGPEVG